MNNTDKAKECILNVIEIDTLYAESDKEILIEHEGSLLNRKKVDKVIIALADKENPEDYYCFVNKVLRNLCECGERRK